MRDFISMISYMQSRKQEIVLQDLVKYKISCGLFCSETIAKRSGMINQLKSLGLSISYLFVPEKNEDFLDGITVLSIDDIPTYCNRIDYMLMYETSMLQTVFYQYFQRYGIATFILRTSEFATQMEIDLFSVLPDLYDVYALLQDSESKKAFRGAITGKFTGQSEDFHYAQEPQYLLEGFMPEKGDIAIDGGAYNGGTGIDFSSLGAEVYAFELDPANYQQCLKASEKHHFTVENMGLWSSKKAASFIPSGTGSHVDKNGTTTTQLIDLDTYVLENQLPRIDYIKLDVEGAEMESLKGAFMSIAKWKPKMAISAYHRFEDLYDLAKYVKSIRPDYTFAFRHYRIDTRNYDLNTEEKDLLRKYDISLLIPTLFETVLYCR